MKSGRICVMLLLTFLAVWACGAAPTTLPIRSAPELLLHDAARNKKLPLRVTWPDSPGKFPVIIWSHGAYGSKDAYKPLVEYWARHGYVVIQPTHEDSVALGQKLGDKRVFQLWQTRPADVSFILDSLATIEKLEPSLHGKLDVERIGVGGHSYGANTAQLVGGAKAFVMGREKSFEDKRVRAVMLLSGQGPGEMLTEKSWASFMRPLFVMSGSRDGPTRTGQPAEWRKKPYELSPPGDKYLVWVEGLDHGYGGITGVRFNPKNKDNPDHVRWTQTATLAFWDAYLKGDASAREFLRSDKLAAETKGAVSVKWK
ncbi:MAG: hypothetical protein N3B01_04965 [Verrucomicrobiae bacterium]|nr:hypothetical protein [Verrucomicrobiae bacterium]